MKEKFHKGDAVSATRTFNGEYIVGEFRGYRLFDDELPESVVGTVFVGGDRTYDVDVDSLRHYESEDEKTLKKIRACLEFGVQNDIIAGWDRDAAMRYLEKTKPSK